MTGLRRGEICALKWSDFDIVERKLHVNRSVTPHGTIGKAKTCYSERVIKLPYSVYQVFLKCCSSKFFPLRQRSSSPSSKSSRLKISLSASSSISMIAFSAAPSQIQATYFVRFIIHPPCENESSWFSKPCTHRTWEQFPQGSHSDMLHSS